MTEDYFPGFEPAGSEPGQPAQAAPARRRGRGRIPRAGLIGGLVAVLGLGGAGVAFAAGSGSPASPASGATSSSTTVPTPHRVKAPFGPFGRRLRLGAPLGRVAHGQLTIPSGSGYKTVEVQKGTVTKVSSTSITIKSSDGYTSTYIVSSSTVVDSQSAGIGSVAVNDQVGILATQVNGQETAVDIVDTSKIKSSRRGFGFSPPSGQTPNKAAAPSGPPGPAPNMSRIGGLFGPGGGYAE